MHVAACILVLRIRVTALYFCSSDALCWEFAAGSIPGSSTFWNVISPRAPAKCREQDSRKLERHVWIASPKRGIHLIWMAAQL